ncbi:MAG: hypothetical protein HQL45_15735 [Alphaproteobacteria bacterium]|nr:hypothetical protein [Alphaproteobacteria bacterium]
MKTADLKILALVMALILLTLAHKTGRWDLLGHLAVDGFFLFMAVRFVRQAIKEWREWQTEEAKAKFQDEAGGTSGNGKGKRV